MPDKCDIVKESIDIVKEADEIREEESSKNTKAVSSSIENDLKMREYLREKFSKGDIISESELNQIFNELYGKKSDRIKLANKINGLMEANESLKSYMNVYIAEHLPPKVQVVENRIFIDEEGNKTTKKVMVLSNLPIKTLRVILDEALTPGKWRESKVGFWGHPMNFDGILSHIITQKQRSLRDPSGAYWIITKATDEYPTNVSARINTFTSESFADATHGMNEIYQRIANISRFSDNTRNEEKKLTALFSRYMMGWIYKDKNTGEWMIYEDYQVREDEDGRAMTYESTGDFMFGFQNPVKLENYIPAEGKKGDWYVNFKKMGKKAEKEFFELTKEARKIDDELFKYMQKHMTESLYGDPKNPKDKGLIGELYKTFALSGLKEDEIKQIFFKPNSKSSKDLIKRLNTKEKKMYNILFDTFGTIINDQFVIANGHKILFPNEEGYRQNHWPIIYDRTVFGFMLKKLIKELDSRVNSLIDIKKIGLDTKGNPLTSEQMSKVKDEIALLQSKLDNAKRIDMNRLNYSEDTMNGGMVVPFVSDNKYLKNISNAYDIKNARVDNSVYYEYLKNVMSSIERNRLSGKLVAALRQSSENNSEKMNKVVTNEAINLFKTIFNTPDVNGPFSRTKLGEVFGNVENINSFLNKWVPGRDKSAQQLNNTYRIINNALTAQYLGGFFTTAQNKIDVYRNIIHFGNSAFEQGKDLYNDDIQGPLWKQLIQMSGITEFSDFFSRSMVSGIGEIELELDVAAGITREMWIYWSDINKGMNIDKAEAKFRKAISGYLAKSNAVMEAEDIVIQDKGALKREEAEIRQQRRLAWTNKVVNLAITKQYVARDAFQLPGFKRKLANFLKQPTEFFIDKYISFFGEFTMSDTEKYIRSISFVIGVNRAIETGLLKGPIDEILKNEEDIATAIFYGQTYNKVVNFSLSTQAIGKYGQGGHGKFHAKFKTWSSQKFGSDSRIFRDAYRSLLTEADRARNEGKGLKVWKPYDAARMAAVWLKVFKQVGLYPFGKKARQKYDRVTSNEIATLRAFLLGQGLFTVAFDILTLGVFPALGGLRAAMYYGTGTRALRGYTSDYFSFLMAIPLLILKAIVGGGGDDEDKDLQRTLTYYLRKTHLGFGAIWTFDFIMLILSPVMLDNESKKDKALNVVNPMTGGSTILGRSFKGISKKVLEED